MVKFIVPGNPIPKARTTQKSKWCKRAVLSRNYQKLVAQYYMIQKDTTQIKGDVFLGCKFYRSDRIRVDCDNLFKAVADGLEYGGAYKNDNQITEMYAKKEYDKNNPRVEIELQEVNNELRK